MTSRAILSGIRSQAIRNNLIKKQQNVNYLLASMSTACANNGTKLQLKQQAPQQQYLLNQQIVFIHLSSRLNESITIESPGFAESIKEGDITFCKKAGETVKADEIVAKIETDKTTIEVPSPKDGVVEELLVQDGSTITANLPIMKISVGGSAAAPAASKPAEPVKPAEPAAPAAPAPSKPVEAARPVSTTLPEVPPVPKQPLTTTLTSQVPVTPFKPVVESAQSIDITKITGTRSETRVKMSKMRQTVANRLKTAQNTCAMLTTFNEINMGNLVDLRKQFGDAFAKKHNLKLGFMSAFVKAAANALKDQPVVNAFIENNEIIYRDYVDISVAVATPKGLVVPVLRNCEKMNYADIEKEIAALGERARLNKLAIEDMQGGTFTISNGGVFGSLFGTPIINLPQSAILGMHGIFDRPVAVNGQVVIRPMMFVALTYDHRLIDGREAVTFLRKIKSAVEDPRTLLLDI